MKHTEFQHCEQAKVRSQMGLSYECCSPQTCRMLGYCQWQKLTAKERDASKQEA